MEENEIVERRVRSVSGAESIRVKKKSVGTKFVENFIEGSMADVKEHLIYDTLIPSIKDFILEAAEDALERLFYNDGRSRSAGNKRKRSSYEKVSYSSYSSSGSKRDRDDRRSSRFDLDEDVQFDTREQAEEALDILLEALDIFHQVSVGDLYDTAEKSSPYTSRNYGWEDLSGVKPKRIRGGKWILDLPRPEVLD